MANTLEKKLNALTPNRRKAIQRRAAELATLKELRIAMELTQKDVAAALHIGQDSVSRLEKRSDMLISTLRTYIESMGGTLEITARFPDRPPITIENLSDTTGNEDRPKP